jgi:hypothetical protein
MLEATASAAETPRLELVRVQPDQFDEIWPSTLPAIRDALLTGDFGDMAALERKQRAGVALLWLLRENDQIYDALVTETAMVNGMKVCNAMAFVIGGCFLLADMTFRLRDYARAEKCKRIRIFGRDFERRTKSVLDAKAIVLAQELR